MSVPSLVLCLATCIAAQTVDQNKLRDVVDESVEKSMKDHNLAGAAVVVVHNGKTIMKRGYGFANLAARTKVDPDKTVFRIGSISKACTLLALTRMIDQGKATKDDDVQKYFGPIPNPRGMKKPIRLSNLMTHTTGLDQIGIGRQIGAFQQSIAQRQGMRPQLGQFLRENNLRRVSEPGEHYRYDTYGTTLAGFIVGKLAGKPYRDAMRSEMFEPLGMTRTSVEVESRFRGELAVGYEQLNGENMAQPYEIYLTTPASSIDSTAADMGKLLEALTSDGTNSAGRFLSANMTQAVLAGQYRPHPEFPGTTHGFHESYDASNDFTVPIRSVEHGGSMAGFRSLLTILPDYKIGVFIVTNTSRFAGGRNPLAGGVMQAVVSQLPNRPKRNRFAVPKPDTSRDLTEFEGNYRYGVFCHSCTPAELAQGAWRPGRPTVVKADNGKLIIRDQLFFPRGGDIFVREDGRQKVFFGRNISKKILFFTYSTSNDTFERE